jgi:hypothetical protein
MRRRNIPEARRCNGGALAMASRKRLKEWGAAPGRLAEKAAAIAEPAKGAPARKDTRRWCRGKRGVPHHPVIVFTPPLYRRGEAECEWDSRWSGDVRWHCHHQEHCGACGKVLRVSVGCGECPAYPGSDGQHAAAAGEARAAEERWLGRQAGRRKVIAGPQHYRRRRAS